MQGPFNHSLLLLARQYREGVSLELPRQQASIRVTILGSVSSQKGRLAIMLIASPSRYRSRLFFLSVRRTRRTTSKRTCVSPQERESVGERVLKKVHAELNLRLIHIRKFA
jgi:hypothetical protein